MLSQSQIATLEANGCRCSDWSRISATEGFDPAFCRNVEFIGEVTLGANGADIAVGGIPSRCGIYNATLADCSVADNVYIANISGALCRLDIRRGSIIEGVHTIQCPAEGSHFGCNVKVEALNETGGREVNINPCLSAPLAYLQAFHRHSASLSHAIEKGAEEIAAKAFARRSPIGPDAEIRGCGDISGVAITDGARVIGASRLTNGTISGAYVGAGVIAVDFIVVHGATVDSAAILHGAFVGHGATVASGFTAHNSLIFTHSTLENGESAAMFAGPFTTSMHKSTLLIGGYFSFFNAGSNTNQSNHLYKLGPMHQGTLARGCRTGSGSYLMWPAAIAPFTTITGRHYIHPDTREFPFSYLINDEQGRSILLPGAMVGSVGLARDVAKWPSRMSEAASADPVSFRWLSPYTIDLVLDAIDRLRTLLLRLEPGSRATEIEYKGVVIPISAISRGVDKYTMLVRVFTGGIIRRRILSIIATHPEATPDTLLTLLRQQPACPAPGSPEPAGAAASAEFEASCGDSDRWVDLAGLQMPRALLDHLTTTFAAENLTYTDMSRQLAAVGESYPALSWAWAYNNMPRLAGGAITDLSLRSIAHLIEDAANAADALEKQWLRDAAKEFDSDTALLSFGIDAPIATTTASSPAADSDSTSATAEAERRADFARVRGSIATQPFLAKLRRSIADFAAPARALAATLLR